MSRRLPRNALSTLCASEANKRSRSSNRGALVPTGTKKSKSSPSVNTSEARCFKNGELLPLCETRNTQGAAVVAASASQSIDDGNTDDIALPTLIPAHRRRSVRLEQSMRKQAMDQKQPMCGANAHVKDDDDNDNNDDDDNARAIPSSADNPLDGIGHLTRHIRAVHAYALRNQACEDVLRREKTEQVKGVVKAVDSMDVEANAAAAAASPPPQPLSCVATVSPLPKPRVCSAGVSLLNTMETTATHAGPSPHPDRIKMRAQQARVAGERQANEPQLELQLQLQPQPRPQPQRRQQHPHRRRSARLRIIRAHHVEEAALVPRCLTYASPVPTPALAGSLCSYGMRWHGPLRVTASPVPESGLIDYFAALPRHVLLLVFSLLTQRSDNLALRLVNRRCCVVAKAVARARTQALQRDAWYAREDRQLRPAVFGLSGQPNITVSMRSILVNWMVEVHTEFGLSPPTLFSAVNYVDRYCATGTAVSRNRFQLLGLTAIWVASKVEDMFSNPLDDLAWICDDAYVGADFLGQEVQLLLALQFDMNVISVYHFAKLFLHELGSLSAPVVGWNPRQNACRLSSATQRASRPLAAAGLPPLSHRAQTEVDAFLRNMALRSVRLEASCGKNPDNGIMGRLCTYLAECSLLWVALMRERPSLVAAAIVYYASVALQEVIPLHVLLSLTGYTHHDHVLRFFAALKVVARMHADTYKDGHAGEAGSIYVKYLRSGADNTASIAPALDFMDVLTSARDQSPDA